MIKKTLSEQWSNTKRRIDIYPSLAEALKALEPPALPASQPLDLQEAVSAAGGTLVGWAEQGKWAATS